MGTKHFYKGFYHAINPKKILGDPQKIIYRSGLEKNFMMKFDTNERILHWFSERLIVPYVFFNPITKVHENHRYFPDIGCIWLDRKTNAPTKIIIEIKPFEQCFPPEPPKKMNRHYKYKLFEYLKNQSKWMYAKKYCENRGWKFRVLTEKDLAKI